MSDLSKKRVITTEAPWVRFTLIGVALVFILLAGEFYTPFSFLGASGFTTFWKITLPNIRWALLYGVLLCNARAMGEFGAVSVVSGHIRGLTDTLPLHVEVLYNDYDFVGAFAAASVLASLGLVTLVLKTALEWRHAGELAASRRH